MKKKTPIISFEIFPPKEDADGTKLDNLLNNLKVLQKHNPAFISLTYGAGGTTQNSSLNIINRINNELNLIVMPHFTCVNTSKSSVNSYLSEIHNCGIKNILALRGDIPDGVTQEHFDFKHADELVKYIKEKVDFSIGVAGYPEGHMECDKFSNDMKYLKQKVDAGADVIITQMFFDNEKFFNFVKTARNIGITIPIIPGILPILSYKQLHKMLSMAKVTVPQSLLDELEANKDNNDAVKEIGINFATQQCKQLIEFGVSGIHFFTINKSYSVSKILDNLNL